MRWHHWALALGTIAAPIHGMAAQDPAQVEALAPILMMEDRRVFDPDLFATSIVYPDPLVRRSAARAIGQIGSHRGTALLVQALRDRDPGVVTEAFFALGLLHDTSAVGAITARLTSPDTLTAEAVGEAAIALEKIGGAVAVRFLTDAFEGGGSLNSARRNQLLPDAVQYAWRLGADAPADALARFLTDTSSDVRQKALYTLARLRYPGAGRAVLAALRDRSAYTRWTAARGLTRRYAEVAGLPLANVESELARALDDESPSVRVNALDALASFGDSSQVKRVVTLLTDEDGNVQVAAANALGALGGGLAATELDGVLDRANASWALKRSALLGLARVDSSRFAARAGAWFRSPEMRDRLVALAAWAVADTAGSGQAFAIGLGDADPRVRAAALEAWSGVRHPNDSALAQAARGHLTDPDPGIRAAAASALASRASPADLDALVSAWVLAQRDPDSDARVAVFQVLRRLSRSVPDLLEQLAEPPRHAVLDSPEDPVLRAQAARDWPALAAKWGPVAPIETGRTLNDYRSIVRTVMLAPTNTHVTLELEAKGTLDLELFNRDAPLTVANFLRLVDRRYFDGNRWHRVVPNFVVQDGDRTGTGNGGPGYAIRDELNRQRYILPMLGMALSGPDTGGSQWFINLSPQPHLDGGYTIFGRVSGSFVPLNRIVQGDLIRAIHR
jgi:cyclophilin family peptidyl-prolyl cis-trans isomerase/HEAT repeat protein